MKNAEYYINKLGLQAHPEGGFFREVYRSSIMVPGSAVAADCQGQRPASTSIFFLLRSADRSHFHRLNQDEIWHYHDGCPCEISMISPDGRLKQKVLGLDLDNGQSPQLTIPGGYWFGARPLMPESFILLGCTVAPGFDFADFELAKRRELTAKFPQHETIICELTT